MLKSNRIRSEFLGMSHGKASHKLRKSIMHHLAKKVGMSACYRCGEEIEDIENFSIEHKEPWLHVDPNLFWDLDNIAFSHLSCNVRAQRRPLRERTHCPKGHPWDKENTHWAVDKEGRKCRECRVCDLERWHRRKEKANRARRIKRLRRKGLSLRQIAEKVGVSHVTVKKVTDPR